MPISTDLNIEPYFDDYDPKKNYYKVLFRPGVPVQTRELNTLQSMLQTQIERFGDNIFQHGTIVDGCNFGFYPDYSYVKIADSDIDGIVVEPSLLQGLLVKNSNNLTAFVQNYADGFEASVPDLKTIFVNYRNSGNSGSMNEFANSDVLTFFSPNNSLFSVAIENGGTGFSNSDNVVFLSAILVSNATGSFANGDYIVQGSANVQVIGVDNNTVTNSSILYLKPRASDLTGGANSDAWTITTGNVQNSSNTASGTVVKLYGSGAKAKIVTNGIGTIINVNLTSQGGGYLVLPTVVVQSTNNSSGVSALDLTPRNYYKKVRVASTANAVGFGYAFSVSEGVIFQKGYFERVEPQTIVVSKYSSYPNSVVAGFSTTEEIIDSNIDSSLFDQSIGTDDENAPGANRLKLTPTLIVLTVEEARANTDFFSIVEWNDGNPYRQIQQTVYSRIGDEMANRTFDAEGDFVLDPFLVTTASVSNTSLEGSYYTAVVDAGTAYVKGRKVQTNYNYRIDVPKGTDTKVVNSQLISINYDAFLRVKEIGGVFQFSTGDTVDLYDTAKGFLSNVALVTTGNTTPQGTKIGTARIRSMVLDSGNPGEADAVYNLYLFNIAMLSGKNFRNVRSVYYNGSSFKGICDAVLTYDPSTNTSIARIESSQDDTLVFTTGLESIRNSNNTTYIYRTIDQTVTVANNGIATKSIAAVPNEFYPYSGALSNAQMRELQVIPLGNNLIQYSPLTGTLNADSSLSGVTGTSTTFISDFVAGDYIYMYPNNSTYDIRKILSVVNNTYMTLDANVSFTNASCNFKHIYPKNVPVPFGSRAGLSSNVNSNGNILTLNFGFTIDSATAITLGLGVNIQRSGTSSTSKSTNRNQFVKLQLSNNAANTVGPWCLGVSDVFRLRNVYIGTSTVNTASVNVTNEFYIDSNQNPNYCDLSYLYVKPKSGITLTSSDYLLVEFDYYTRSGAGYFDTVSYLHTANATQIANLESQPLSGLSTAAVSWEVPEIYSTKGDYFDLLNCLDFRPAAVNTVAVSSNASLAPLNPAYSLSFGNTANPSNDLKFPLPDSILTTNFEYYLGRKDTITVGKDGNMAITRGTSSSNPKDRFEPPVPNDALKLQTINVPAYPNLPKNPSAQTLEIVSTGVFNERDLNTRIKNHLLTQTISANQIKYAQPAVYRASDIGKLERRIEALEYVTSLNLLETSITQKVIPSSLDPALNRFKFGFVVDDYSSYLYQDRTNPQYSAQIEELNIEFDKTSAVNVSTLGVFSSNRLVPDKFEWSLQHAGAAFSAAFINYPLISQNNATVPTVTNTSTNTTSNTTTNTSVNTSVTSVTIQDTGYYYHGASFYIESWMRDITNKVKFSNTAGTATMYIEFGSWVNLSDVIVRVWQINPRSGGGVLVMDSSQATDLTYDEREYVRHNQALNVLLQRYLDPGTYPVLPNSTDDGFYSRLNNGYWWSDKGKPSYGDYDTYIWDPRQRVGLGKMQWQHNPFLGTEYYFDAFVPQLELTWGTVRWVLEYPIDINVEQRIATQADPITGFPVTYSGLMSGHSSGSPTTINGVTYTFDRITLSCSGLKPGSVHKFYIDGTDMTSKVQQFGRRIGDGLQTDGNGRLMFNYFFDDLYINKLNNAKISKGNVVEQAADKFNQASSDYYFVPSFTFFEVSAVNSYTFMNMPITHPSSVISF